jgi:hypothetical protein
MSTKDRLLSDLNDVAELFADTVRPDGHYAGWRGKEVLCHLAPAARIVAAVVAARAEQRQPTEVELYGRNLTEAESRITSLDEINHAVQEEHSHLTYDEASQFWRSQLARIFMELGRVSEEQLEAKITYPPAWATPHLYLVVDTFLSHCRSHVATVYDQ